MVGPDAIVGVPLAAPPGHHAGNASVHRGRSTGNGDVVEHGARVAVSEALNAQLGGGAYRGEHGALEDPAWTVRCAALSTNRIGAPKLHIIDEYSHGFECG